MNHQKAAPFVCIPSIVHDRDCMFDALIYKHKFLQLNQINLFFCAYIDQADNERRFQIWSRIFLDKHHMSLEQDNICEAEILLSHSYWTRYLQLCVPIHRIGGWQTIFHHWNFHLMKVTCHSKMLKAGEIADWMCILTAMFLYPAVLTCTLMQFWIYIQVYIEVYIYTIYIYIQYT